MKKFFTLCALAISMAAQTAFANVSFNDMFPVMLSNDLPTGWAAISNNASAQTEKVADGLKITCNQESANYRADLKYNMFGDYNGNGDIWIDIDASKYKVFAVKFIGERPKSGVLKLSNISVSGSWIKNADGYSLSESKWTDIADADGNHTYYWTIGGDNWTGDLAIDRIEIVIADIKKDEDKTFTVSEIGWYESEEALKNTLSYAVFNETTGTGYSTLKEAWTAVASGDVILLNANQEISDDRLTCGGKTITVRGNKPGVKLTRGNMNKFLFLANDGSDNLTVEDLIIDGNDYAATTNLIAIEKGKGTFNNVVIQNAINSNGGILSDNNTATVVLNNFSSTNCTTADNYGIVHLNQSRSTISGKINTSISLNATCTIGVGDDFSGDVKLYVGSHASGSKIVTNCTDASAFTLANSDLYFKVDGSNLVLAESVPVYNETKHTGYANVTTAWKGASDGDVILVNENQEVSERLNSDSRSITIKGNADGVKITRTNANNMMFLANSNGKVTTLENITLDGNSASTDRNFTEASSGGKMVFNNVTVSNAISTNGVGLVVAKTSGKLALNGISFENCTSPGGNVEVFIGSQGSTISGNNSMALCVEESNAGSVAVEGELTNTTPIKLTPYNSANSEVVIDFSVGYNVISGCDDASKFALNCANEQLILSAVDGNLVVAEEAVTGIEDIEGAAADAPVEYYNLQGVRVANPTNGIYVRRQGKTVTKVML
jgi:hypothetical protein